MQFSTYYVGFVVAAMTSVSFASPMPQAFDTNNFTAGIFQGALGESLDGVNNGFALASSIINPTVDSNSTANSTAKLEPQFGTGVLLGSIFNATGSGIGLGSGIASTIGNSFAGFNTNTTAAANTTAGNTTPTGNTTTMANTTVTPANTSFRSSLRAGLRVGKREPQFGTGGLLNSIFNATGSGIGLGSGIANTIGSSFTGLNSNTPVAANTSAGNTTTTGNTTATGNTTVTPANTSFRTSLRAGLRGGKREPQVDVAPFVGGIEASAFDQVIDVLANGFDSVPGFTN